MTGSLVGSGPLVAARVDPADPCPDMLLVVSRDGFAISFAADTTTQEEQDECHGHLAFQRLLVHSDRCNYLVN